MGQSMKMQVKAYATDDSDGLMLWELAQLNVQSGVAQRSSSGESGLIPVALWRPVQPRPNSRCRLILAHPERPFGGLDLVADAPARDKRTGERCVGEVDRNRVVEHAARPRQGGSPSKSVSSGRRGLPLLCLNHRREPPAGGSVLMPALGISEKFPMTSRNLSSICKKYLGLTFVISGVLFWMLVI